MFIIRRQSLKSLSLVVAGSILLSSCSFFTTDPIPGPDKQGVGTIVGAASGATAGAVTGAQVTASTGPGALIGAGFGAVFGLLSGIGIDLLEEDELTRAYEAERLRELAWVQEVLAEHFARRLEIHPNRDIYPADWFFDGDSVKLRSEGYLLIEEIARLQKNRLPWSRLIVAAYNTSSSESKYAEFLTHNRAQSIANQFIRSGVEPRRVMTKGMIIEEPVLVDPDDHPSRYKQAIEIIALDN